MGQQGLDDALSAIVATPDSGGDESAVLGRIESALYGEEPEKAPEAAAEETETESEETQQTDEVEGDEPTEESELEGPEDEDGDDAEDEEESEDEETEGSEDEEAELELTEEQISEVLGLKQGHAKLDEDGNVLVRTKVDGEVKFVPMQELAASYQMSKHYDSKIQQATEAKKEFEAFKQAETKKIHDTAVGATALTRMLEQELLKDYQSVNMDALRASNPAEWSARQQEFQHKASQLQQAKQQLHQLLQHQQRQDREKMEIARKQKILEETEKLIDAIPAWSDDEVATREIDHMQTVISKEFGFAPDELRNLGDHRLVRVFLRAAENTGVQETAKEVKKRLRKVPKITKPGTTTKNSEVKSRKQAKNKQDRLKTSGKIQDVASILVDRI